MKFILLIIVLLLPTFAAAQEHHAQGHAFYQGWENGKGGGCCNDRDCGALQDDQVEETKDGTFLHIQGQRCEVKSWMYLKKGNAPNWQVHHACILVDTTRKDAWYPHDSVCGRLLCYQPKPGL